MGKLRRAGDVVGIVEGWADSTGVTPQMLRATDGETGSQGIACRAKVLAQPPLLSTSGPLASRRHRRGQAVRQCSSHHPRDRRPQAQRLFSLAYLSLKHAEGYGPYRQKRQLFVLLFMSQAFTSVTATRLCNLPPAQLLLLLRLRHCAILYCL